jgi:two-component system, cell cycle response regulator
MPFGHRWHVQTGYHSMSEKNKNIRILIVDDEPEARETIADILTEEGFIVETTDSAQKALALLEHSAFDLIISDLRMPGMDGITLTKNVKALSIDSPIIVITAFATIQDAVDSMKAGAYDFITKPFNIDHIRLTVDKALEANRLMHLAREREFYKALSHSDEMTQLANYRSLTETLATEITRALRYSRPLTVMMIDIDNFKVCNDTFGHLAGDRAIKDIARLIKKNTRGADFVARYGGEEFFVILPETAPDEALVVAERIRESIELFSFTAEDGTSIGRLTVTIGLSTLPEKAGTQTELIDTADKALYHGKANGKNRVIVYADPM